MQNGLLLVNVLNATAREQWNSFVSRWPDFELMQSYEWGEFKQSLGWKVVRLVVERDGQWIAGAQMLIKPLLSGLISIVYVPRGPLLDWKDKAVVQTLLSSMHSLARQHRAIVLKIEPPIRYSPDMRQIFQSLGFRRSHFDNQPRCTMWIDLTFDLDTLFARMHKTTRYNIRFSARQGVTVYKATVSDLDTFYHLLELTATRSGFPVRSREYYRQEWDALAPHGYLELFLARYQDEILAVRIPAIFGNKAATLHSASSDAYRELKPNELLMWESLRWAKSQGCTIYDVWGIPDQVGEHLYKGYPLPEEPRGGLWGVYNFKRGFGGDVVYYVGAYDSVYSPFWYWTLNTAMTKLGSLEKLAQLGDRLGLKADLGISI
jgi:lipid II:glycine glycyltransferase (peptidoglycan interpeptide bridge formation enzyme)